MKKLKRSLSLILAIILIASMFPSAFADGDSELAIPEEAFNNAEPEVFAEPEPDPEATSVNSDYLQVTIDNTTDPDEQTSLYIDKSETYIQEGQGEGGGDKVAVLPDAVVCSHDYEYTLAPNYEYVDSANCCLVTHKTAICKYCGDTIYPDADYAAATAHVDADTNGKCDNCGGLMGKVECTGEHNYGEELYEDHIEYKANKDDKVYCEKQTYKYQECKDCGHRNPIEKPEVDKQHKHEFGDSALWTYEKPECSSEYTVYKKCICCNAVYAFVLGAQAAHTDGDTDNYCDICGEVVNPATKTEAAGAGANSVVFSVSGNTLTFEGKNGNAAAIDDYEVILGKADVDGDGDKDTIVTGAQTPWQQFKDTVNTVVIKKTIERIGDWSLSFFDKLKEVIIEGNTQIGDYAFAGDENLEAVTYQTTAPTLDNENVTVEHKGVKDVGSTAFVGAGAVNQQYYCTNAQLAKAAKQSFVEFGADDVEVCPLHTNCRIVYGYAPTEKEFGLSNGLYCDACQSWVEYQYKIYPNGKEATGKYRFTELKKLKEVPDTLKDLDKYNTLEKITALAEEFAEKLADEYEETFKGALLKKNYKLYSIKLLEQYSVKQDKHIINIPYPAGTNPDSYEYIVLQLQKDGTYKELDTFMTNKGIQIETESLLPVGVAWSVK